MNLYHVSAEKMQLKVNESIALIYRGRKHHLDVALLHSPRCWKGHCSREESEYSWHDAWRNLEDIHRSGQVRAIGVSNFEPWELEELLSFATVPVSIVQNWMDPFRQDSHVILCM